MGAMVYSFLWVTSRTLSYGSYGIFLLMGNLKNPKLWELWYIVPDPMFMAQLHAWHPYTIPNSIGVAVISSLWREGPQKVFRRCQVHPLCSKYMLPVL